ncbi:4a-hydroxytetrahydrobiopterin dehydratase, partial [Streptomyces sp. SID8455]|nr:4a-hydroxytetrahydrobiopterin dehydratase [Streptomyces sp. SID8455]
IARIQEELNHHSDLTLGYNTVALSVHTHDAGGAVTEKDLELAARVAAAAPAHGAE